MQVLEEQVCGSSVLNHTVSFKKIKNPNLILVFYRAARLLSTFPSDRRETEGGFVVLTTKPGPYAAHAFRKTLLVIFLYARMYVMLYIVGKSRPRTAGHNFDF